MDFLAGAKPVIRGQCDACAHSRNVWISELDNPDLPCSHRNRGCPGFTRVVYRGPISWMPAELHNGGCSCDAREQRSADASVGAAPAPRAAACGAAPAPHAVAADEVAKLIDMGFVADQARAALARCGSIEAAIEWLTTDGNASAEVGACGAAGVCPADASLEADVGECAICCEELLLADAAMRCAGQGGRRHHFHAHCLSTWVRQCRSSGSEATCPECRGPVQVHARRLQDFLQEKQSTLTPEDQEVFQNLAGKDRKGWSDVRKDLLKVGMIAGVGVGAALAVVGVVAGLSALSRSSRDQGERRR